VSSAARIRPRRPPQRSNLPESPGRAGGLPNLITASFPKQRPNTWRQFVSTRNSEPGSEMPLSVSSSTLSAWRLRGRKPGGWFTHPASGVSGYCAFHMPCSIGCSLAAYRSRRLLITGAARDIGLRGLGCSNFSLHRTRQTAARPVNLIYMDLAGPAGPAQSVHGLGVRGSYPGRSPFQTTPRGIALAFG